MMLSISTFLFSILSISYSIVQFIINYFHNKQSLSYPIREKSDVIHFLIETHNNLQDIETQYMITFSNKRLQPCFAT